MEAADLWSKWVQENGIEQHFGPGRPTDQHGTPYTSVCVGYGGGHNTIEEGQEFEHILVDFDHVNRTMAFINSLTDWLAGRTVIVWRTMPLPAFWRDKEGRSCSQMRARLTAYTKEEWDRLQSESEASGGKASSDGGASAASEGDGTHPNQTLYA